VRKPRTGSLREFRVLTADYSGQITKTQILPA
jgi:hypothetical protein